MATKRKQRGKPSGNGKVAPKEFSPTAAAVVVAIAAERADTAIRNTQRLVLAAAMSLEAEQAAATAAIKADSPTNGILAAQASAIRRQAMRAASTAFHDLPNELMRARRTMEAGGASKADLEMALKVSGDELEAIAREWAEHCIQHPAVPAGLAVHDRLQETAEHGVKAELAMKEQAALTPEDARNKFCYEAWQRGQTYKEIFVALKAHPEWEAFGGELGVRTGRDAWAHKNNLPIRKGSRGRRPNAR